MLIFTTIAPHNPPLLLIAILCFGIGLQSGLLLRRWWGLIAPAALGGLIILWAITEEGIGYNRNTAIILPTLSIIYFAPSIFGVVTGHSVRNIYFRRCNT